LLEAETHNKAKIDREIMVANCILEGVVFTSGVLEVGCRNASVGEGFHVHHLFLVSENQIISVGEDPTTILLNLIIVNNNNNSNKIANIY
jgi:hypothetical protein